MRNSNDRVRVKVYAYFTADIDLERVELDPRWTAMNHGINISDPEIAKEQLFKYINHYVLSGPQLLTNAPFTNGPSDVWVSEMEIENERPNPPVS